MVGQEKVHIMQYNPALPFHERYVKNPPPLPPALLQRVEKDAITLCRALGYDLNTVEFAVEEGLLVQGDRRLLRMALNHLLINAWKFTQKHPRAKIELGARQGDGGPTYFVSDDGAGFDMAYTDKLFGPFQRLHLSTEFGGRGIGLAAVRRIIHRHGGRVWAEGAVGEGATFYFTLPHAQSDEQEEESVGRYGL